MSTTEVTTPLTYAGLRNKSREWLIDALVMCGKHCEAQDRLLDEASKRYLTHGELPHGDDIIQGLQDENAALREGRQTPSEIKTLKDWRDAHAEIERLRKALDQAVFGGEITLFRENCMDYGDAEWVGFGAGKFQILAQLVPELADCLREKEANHGN